MGDNVANVTFDQNAGITDHLISLDNINSVPFQEIPWLGTLKIYFKNNGANLDHVPNSMPSLVMFIALLFGMLFLADMLTLRRSSRELEKELDTIIEERRPPPHHFHWNPEKGMPLRMRVVCRRFFFLKSMKISSSFTVSTIFCGMLSSISLVLPALPKDLTRAWTIPSISSSEISPPTLLWVRTLSPMVSQTNL